MTERKKYNLIGDRRFYKKVCLITLPIIVQNGITTFVNLLDNIMVGQVGTEQMSGVAIANQLVFIFNLCIFGAVAGAGILGAQFYGSGNHEGLRNTFRFKLVSGIVLSLAFFAIFIFGGETLIGTFLHEGQGGGDLEATLGYGKQYLLVIMAGLIPFALTQGYSGTLRETGQTVVPMIAGIAAVLVNLVFNYILIFGKFGFPALGVVGAALATVISRYVEFAIVAVWTHAHAEQNPFARGLYRHFRIPASLAKQIFIVGLPLFVNEVLWSCGMTFMNQCYSVRGLEVVAAFNIATTIGNVFNVVFLSLGNAVGIIIGQLLGAGKLEQARREDNQLIAFSVFCCVITGGLMCLVAPFFPELYNTDALVKGLATQLILIAGCCQPIYGFIHATYFTLRAGGKSIVTFLFDSAYMWVLSIPVVFTLSRFTALPIQLVYLTAQLTDLIKVCIGFVLVKKGVWMKTIVDKNE
ncbi:MAG: MATE family efflux transporter [Firmicutes bacterium]|nr:MATE family efflux transporter [Bacillota bacterium]